MQKEGKTELQVILDLPVEVAAVNYIPLSICALFCLSLTPWYKYKQKQCYGMSQTGDGRGCCTKDLYLPDRVLDASPSAVTSNSYLEILGTAGGSKFYTVKMCSERANCRQKKSI